MSDYDLLIVDDDLSLLKGLQRSLRKKFNMLIASDVETALDLISQHSFAVLISDMKMPYMYGDDFLIMVKTMSPLTVRICLSGESSSSQTLKAINEGEVFRFLAKPCDKETLTKTINEAIDIHKAQKSGNSELDATAKGIIYILLDILNHVTPEIIQFSFKVAKDCKLVSDKLKLHNQWELEVTSLLMFHCCVHERVYNIDKLMNPETLSSVFKRSAISLKKLPTFIKISENLEELSSLVTKDEQIQKIESLAQLIKFCLYQTYWKDDTAKDEKLLKLFSENVLPWSFIESTSKKSQSSKNKNKVKIEELEPGMIILDSITTKSGMNLAKENDTLTEKSLNSIMRLIIKKMLDGSQLISIRPEDG